MKGKATGVDYTCAAWHPNLNKKYKNKLQDLRDKCTRF